MSVRVAVILGVSFAVMGCGFFDPNVGPLVDDAGRTTPLVDAGADVSSATDGGGDTGGLRPVSFRFDIRPLMDRSNRDPSGHGCMACHYSTQGDHAGLDATGLDLATLGALRRGGANTGTAIVIPGNPTDSKLPQKLLGTFPRGARMPRDGPPYWQPADIALVERWIAEGAIGADDE